MIKISNKKLEQKKGFPLPGETRKAMLKDISCEVLILERKKDLYRVDVKSGTNYLYKDVWLDEGRFWNF